MFRINKLTDYAVVLLVDMARSDKVRAAQQIALDTGVPLPTVAKVMKALLRSGLVVSHRGACGGYGLAHPPRSITVADMIQALEGPIALTACVDKAPHADGEEACGLGSLCPMNGQWDTVNRRVEAALRTVTLADMAAGPLPAFAPEFTRARAAVLAAEMGAERAGEMAS
ncbi:SUF system Fe-S cluster assembly regulator [Pararhodospirillum oryzae]|uniref:SUF system Fe-S cluster assembly regulator n=1 Tax=Pararhodospirillum oryzae TaxID=478448 RepID=A0A512H4X0_9PROT|nr:SUF system Fe-S cluster assembly regulator [Pararhodospirillum oryzae]GEO80430.1 SUF system Fe-S cluster assembly regulator [Pararhodospirillum oryzae]